MINHVVDSKPQVKPNAISKSIPPKELLNLIKEIDKQKGDFEATAKTAIKALEKVMEMEETK